MSLTGLENTFTVGTQGIQTPHVRDNFLPVPTNEDWCFLGVVLSEESGLATVRKHWDQSAAPKVFYCNVQYEGNSAVTPPAGVIGIADVVRVYRAGDFNSTGTTGDFEFHTEDLDKRSFLILVSRCSRLTFVQDIDGAGTGREVVFDEFGSPSFAPGSSNTPIQPADPLSFFHNSNPPYAVGRIYPAVFGGTRYIVFLPAKGPTEVSFIKSAAGETFTLDVDGSGHVVNFS